MKKLNEIRFRMAQFLRTISGIMKYNYCINALFSVFFIFCSPIHPSIIEWQIQNGEFCVLIKLLLASKKASRTEKS